jgi:hypothetical protein
MVEISCAHRMRKNSCTLVIGGRDCEKNFIIVGSLLAASYTVWFICPPGWFVPICLLRAV